MAIFALSLLKTKIKETGMKFSKLELIKLIRVVIILHTRVRC